MAFKIVTMIAIAIMLAISIQMVASDDPPDENKVDTELLNIFSDKKNVLKVLTIFALAKQEDGKKKAKDKIKTYKNTPARLTEILNKIAVSPNETMSTLKPVRDELDKKLMLECAAYAICIKPLWHLTKRLGCTALRYIGLTVWSSGEVIHSLHDAVEEGMKAANHNPDPQVKQAMAKVAEVGSNAKEFGGKLDNIAVSEKEKNRRGAKQTSSNAAASESIETKTPQYLGSKQTEVPAHGNSDRTSEPALVTHGTSVQPEEPAHGNLGETEGARHE